MSKMSVNERLLANLLDQVDTLKAEVKKGGSNSRQTNVSNQCSKELLAAVSKGLPATRDLSDNGQHEAMLQLASRILVSNVDLTHFGSLVFNAQPTSPPILIQATKAAQSYEALRECPPMHLTVLFAMYHEQNRIQPGGVGSKTPTGQDFLRNKVRELRWLFAANPEATWNLVGCDDGCDEGSGALAEKIIEEEGLGDCVTVMYLQDCINAQIPMFSTIKTTKDSRKGGSILYGLHQTHADSGKLAGNKPHLVVYTDADLSTGMECAGQLLHSCLVEGCCFSQGARYGYDESFLVKEGGASPHPESHYEQPNVLFITWRHFVRKHLLPNIAHLYDTNVPFKCFRVEDLPVLLPHCSIWGPAFDMQLLLTAVQHYCGTKGVSPAKAVGVRPIMFTEDFEESNFTANSSNPDASFQTFCRISKEIAQMHHQYKSEEAQGKAAEVLAFVDKLDDAQFKAMMLGVEKQLGRRLLFDFEFDLQMCAQLAEAKL